MSCKVALHTCTAAVQVFVASRQETLRPACSMDAAALCLSVRELTRYSKRICKFALALHHQTAVLLRVPNCRGRRQA